MSRKVQQFTQKIQYPQNTHNFYVSIPNLIDEALNFLVESTSFPTYKFRTITLWSRGEPIDYPGLPESQRTWSVTVPESDDGKIHKIIKALLAEMWDEKSGVFLPPKYRDIQVFARDTQDRITFSAILKGAFFKGPDVINLANSDPTAVWKWPLEFNFQYVETVSGNNPGSQDPHSI